MKKIGIFLIFFLLFAFSCKQEPNLIKKEHYPIEKQENNILINFKKILFLTKINSLKFIFTCLISIQDILIQHSIVL